jgi:hypothetical protein
LALLFFLRYKGALNRRPHFWSNRQGLNMKPRYWLLLPALALSQTVHAADAADVSPYDANPACMDPNTNSSTGNCVIQSKGTPRKIYPPPGPSSMPGNTIGAGGSAGTGQPAATPGSSSPDHPERGRSSGK